MSAFRITTFLNKFDALREIEREMAFMEGRMGSEKELHGNVFPKTLLPAADHSGKGLADLVAIERKRLDEDLRRHGAVLLRGFDVRSAEDFSRVVTAFGWDEFVYAGAANRAKLADRVLTVNTEPLHLFLNFHHEMSLIKEYPNKIIFCCLEPPPEGGETSIIRSDFIVEKMEERVPLSMQKMEEEGIIAIMHTKGWQRMLNTEDEIEAEKRAMKKFICNSVKFNDDGTADFTYGPMSPVKEFDGKRVMWHMITEYNLAERNSKVSYGDGSAIPEEAINAYNKIIDEGCVDVKWQQGDILVVDNLTVQHARRPGKPPRVVLVSLSH